MLLSAPPALIHPPGEEAGVREPLAGPAFEAALLYLLVLWTLCVLLPALFAAT